MEDNSSLSSPFVQAWKLLRAPAAIFVIALLAAQNLAYQTTFNWFAEQRDVDGLRGFVAVARLAMGVVAGIVMYLLGSKLIGHGAAVSGGMMARWFGLLILFYWLRGFLMTIAGVISVPLGVADNQQLLPIMVSLLPSIVIFPFVVRLLALAGGLDSPRIGRTWINLSTQHIYYFVGYALVLSTSSIGFMFLSQNLSIHSSSTWMVMNCLISGVISTFAYLLALSAALAMAPQDASVSEHFS